MLRRRILLLGLGAAALGAAAPAGAQPVAVIIAPVAPPPLRRETRPRPPAPGLVWYPGYWHWDGRGYVWVQGNWVPPPRPRQRWVPGHWVRRRDGWHWVPGHWR